MKKHCCIDCEKLLTTTNSKILRCRECYLKFRRDHKVMRNCYCIDCHKLLSKNAYYVNTKRCRDCQDKYRKFLIKDSNNPNYKDGKTNNTFCVDCNKKIHLRAKRCRNCQDIRRRTMLQKDGNPNWQDGASFLPYSKDFSEELKEEIRNRDNHKCQLCHIQENAHLLSYNLKLLIHHIDYNKQNCLEENLITLCFSCHAPTQVNREYWQEYFENLIQCKERLLIGL